MLRCFAGTSCVFFGLVKALFLCGFKTVNIAVNLFREETSTKHFTPVKNLMISVLFNHFSDN